VAARDISEIKVRDVVFPFCTSEHFVPDVLQEKLGSDLGVVLLYRFNLGEPFIRDSRSSRQVRFACE